VVSKKVPVEVILKEYAKLGLTHRHNRCTECGRRLKFTPGAILIGPAIGPQRFQTCRSCGFENPTLTQKVAESLESQGYELGDSEGSPNLPECFNCQKELLLSKDFTKAFCCKCGGAWDRFTIEEIFGYPLSPHLAGQIPIAPDNSNEAKELELLISNSDIDSGTAYRVIRVVPSDDTSQEDMSLSEIVAKNFKQEMSGFPKEFKETLVAQWTAPIKFVRKIGRKETKDDTETKEGISQRIGAQYVAVYEDYIAHYIWDGENLEVSEVSYADIFMDASAPLVIPFAVVTKSNKQYPDFMKFWAQFWVIYRSNLEPFKEILFGDKARAENERLANEVPPGVFGQVSLATELEKLAQLRSQGLLTDEEFQNAKSRLLS
jgi:hypothetical protein